MRSTRRGFGRRALSFGLAIFCAITLMSVGFAAWVLSNNASLDSTGGIKTETITDKSVNIVITNADNKKQLFDSVDESGVGTGPQNLVFGHLPVDNPDANKGFIQTDGEEGSALNEDLFFTVKGNVDNIDKIGELHFQVRVPDSLLTAAGLSRVGDTWSYDPAKAFIRLPSFARDSEGHQIPYITGALTAPDGEGKVKYEYGWDGTSMTEDFLWINPSELLSKNEGTRVDERGNEYTIKYVSGRTDKLEFELTIKFEWGARYLGMNPNYFYDVEERKLGQHDQLTSATDVPNKYTTADMNMVNYDLLLLQAVVNGLDLEKEDYLAGKTISESEVYKPTGIELNGATLEAYINANPDGIKAKLAILQENIETAIAHLGVGSNPKAPVYAFWIYADVK
ncbi:MAG: hypothetical protein IJE50_05465 [Clostridia bacterium]|nr:hypothetical protein [Clostridia bacterium]MBQ3041764.1 hypothetical protein [Clostridia bacterium]